MKVYIAGSEPPFRGEIVLEGESPEIIEPLIKGMEEKDPLIGNVAVELSTAQVQIFERMPLVRVEYL